MNVDGRLLQVVDIMKMNIDKVLERDQKLSQLDDRADALQVRSCLLAATCIKVTPPAGGRVAVREVGGRAQEQDDVEEHENDHHHGRRRPAHHHHHVQFVAPHYPSSLG